MPEGRDPRIFFAAERTLLAWLRTGLTIIGLGFVVSRFGLFLRVVGHQSAAPTPVGSTELGIGLVVLGAVVIVLAAVQHARFCRRLTETDRPPGYWLGMAFWVTLLVAAAALVLAAYLVTTLKKGSGVFSGKDSRPLF
jgi:putative membrane protein